MEDFKQKRNRCVYLHKKKGTSDVFYVGIGNQKYRPWNFTDRTDFWKKTAEKYGVDVEILHKDLTWDEAGEIEKELIKFYGKRCDDTGCLVNFQDGGDSGGTRRGKMHHYKGKKRSPEMKVKSIVSKTKKAKVKMPSKKVVELILKLHNKSSHVTGVSSLARRFKMSRAVVMDIIDGTSPFLDYYGLK